MPVTKHRLRVRVLGTRWFVESVRRRVAWQLLFQSANNRAMVHRQHRAAPRSLCAACGSVTMKCLCFKRSNDHAEGEYRLAAIEPVRRKNRKLVAFSCVVRVKPD